VIQSLLVREEEEQSFFVLQNLMRLIIRSSNLKIIKVILRLQSRDAQGEQSQSNVLMWPYIQLKKQKLDVLFRNENKIMKIKSFSGHSYCLCPRFSKIS